MCGAPSPLCIASGFVLWPVAALCGGVFLSVSLAWECARCCVFTCHRHDGPHAGCCEVMGVRESAAWPIDNPPWDWHWIRLRPGVPCCRACLRIATTVHESSQFDLTEFAVVEDADIKPRPPGRLYMAMEE